MNFNSRGVSLYITVMLMSIILAVVLGLSAIVYGQMKMIRGIEYSVIAIYAADTGVEHALRDIYANSPLASYTGSLDANRGYTPGYAVSVVCGTLLAVDCPVIGQDNSEPSCTAQFYCIRSTGTYQGTKRAIEVKI